jgi:hypothetical protein
MERKKKKATSASAKHPEILVEADIEKLDLNGTVYDGLEMDGTLMWEIWRSVLRHWPSALVHDIYVPDVVPLFVSL